MKPILKTFLIIFIANNIFAQYLPSISEISIANSGIAKSDDVFGFYSNPASSYQLYNREFGVFYSPAPFGLSELSNSYIAYCEPTAIGSFAIGFKNYGFELYRENILSVNYSNIINHYFIYGITANFNRLSIKNYSSKAALSLDIGSLSFITKNLQIATSITNILRNSYFTHDSDIPIIGSMGINYDIYNDFSISASIEKELDFPTSFRMGITYLPIQYLTIMCGFSDQPNRICCGVSLNYSSFIIEYAYFDHNILGGTHQLGLRFTFDTLDDKRTFIKEKVFR